MSKLQDFHNISDITGNDKVLVVRKNDQGLAKISDLPIKSDIPQSLKDDMNAVLNKKFGTGKTYPPLGWPDDVNLLGELKIKTASDAIASFPDGANDVPIKEGIFYAEPIQDLNKQSAPYPAGCSKNLFDKDNANMVDGFINTEDFSTNVTAGEKTIYIPITGGTTYTISKGYTSQFAVATSDVIPTNGATFTNVYRQQAWPKVHSLTITAGPNDLYLWATIYTNMEVYTLNEILDSLQIEIGPSETSYAPYSNICPIYGHTSMNIIHTGKNLIKLSADKYADGQNSTATYTDSGATVTATGKYGRAGYTFAIKKGQTYTLSFNGLSTSDYNRIYLNSKVGWSGQFRNILISSVEETHYAVTFTATTDLLFIGLYVSGTTTEGAMTVSNVQLELSLTETTYESYNGETHKWTFPPFGKNLFDKDHANVVNGYIDTYAFNTGNANAKTIYIPIKGSTTYTVSKIAGQRFQIATAPAIPADSVAYTSMVSQSGRQSSLTITSGTNDTYLWAWVYLDGTDTGTLADMLASVQIEKSNQATAYEPYQSMFTGYVSALTGEVTVTHILKEYAVADMDNSDNYPGWKSAGVRALGLATNVYNSVLNVGDEFSVNTNGTTNDIVFLSKNKYGMTQTQWQTTYPDLIVQILIPLVTPITVTLESVSLQTKLGNNNFYCNTGDTKIDYRSNGDVITPEPPSLITKTVTENGTYLAEDDEADGYYSFTVNVPEPPEPPAPEPPALDSKTVTANGTYKAEDDELDGYSQVTVTVPGPDLGTKTITANGSYSASSDHLDGYSNVNVSVPSPTLGSKSVTQNGTYHASDDNVDGYNDITVNVGSPSLDVKNITANGIYMAQDDNLDGYSGVNVEVSGPTLIEKSVTANGTYEASDDEADGYSSVTVNVPTHGDLIKLMENNSISNRLDLIDDVVKTEATRIDGALFREKAIHRISLSTIIHVGSYAFYQATASGREISMINCVDIGEYAFKDYSRSDDPITTFNFPNLEAVGQYAFQRAKLQCVLDMPKLKTVYNNAFQEVYMSGLNVPLLETIGANAFGSSWVGFDVELPSIVSIGNNAFYNFGSENFTIGENCTSIGNTIFGGNGVTNLYVLATTPPTLAGEFRGGTSGVQHIYVPEDSVEDYKAASIWSNYASIIEGISN